jgi:hypothetical protein
VKPPVSLLNFHSTLWAEAPEVPRTFVEEVLLIPLRIRGMMTTEKNQVAPIIPTTQELFELVTNLPAHFRRDISLRGLRIYGLT